MAARFEGAYHRQVRIWFLAVMGLVGCSARDVSDAASAIDAAVVGRDVHASDAGPRDVGPGAIDADADLGVAIDAEPADAASADTASLTPWTFPVDLSADWTSTGTTVPDRATLLAGCRVDPMLTGHDGTEGLRAALAEAAARAGEGRCVVVLPAGTWRITETLVLASGVALMGQGSQQSQLEFALGAREVPLVRARGGGSPLHSAEGDALGAALGERRFAVSATTARVVGELLRREGRLYAEVSQDNDPSKFPARWAQDYAARGIGQLARIVAVHAEDVELDRPLSEHYLPGTGFTKYLVVRGPRQVVERVGLMDLSLLRLTDAHDSSVLFDLTVGAFVQRVESRDTGWAHVAVDRSLGCSVTSSWFHGAHGHGDGGRGYGVNLRSHTTACRVEDNVLEDLRHALIVQLGANQNVYGYNLSVDSHDELGTTKADISVHGHYAHLNLFEGNDVSYAHVSDWHGPTPRQVLFKNRVRVIGVYVDDASDRTALIDNVVASTLGVASALRADGTVRRLICVGNHAPDGAPLAVSGRSDCDDENVRAWAPRPDSLYRSNALVEPLTGEIAARTRWAAGAVVPQP